MGSDVADAIPVHCECVAVDHPADVNKISDPDEMQRALTTSDNGTAQADVLQLQATGNVSEAATHNSISASYRYQTTIDKPSGEFAFRAVHPQTWLHASAFV